MKTLYNSASQIFSAFRVVFFSLLLFATLSGNLFSQSISSDDKKFIESLATYTSQSSSNTTAQLLAKYGYDESKIPSSITPSEWSQFPALRKIETAYLAAEEAVTGSGKLFLNALAQDLANDYDSAEHLLYEKNSILAKNDSYLNTIKGKTRNFTFSQSINVNQIPRLSGDVKKLILRISSYTEQGALGGLPGVLTRFGLNQDQVYDIIRKSTSHFEALQIGLSKSKIPPSHKERLTYTYDEIKVLYESARKQLSSENPKFPKVIVNKLPKELEDLSNSISKFAVVAPNGKQSFTNEFPDIKKNEKTPRNATLIKTETYYRVSSPNDMKKFNLSKTTFVIEMDKTPKRAFFPSASEFFTNILKSKPLASSKNKYVKMLALTGAISATLYAYTTDDEPEPQDTTILDDSLSDRDIDNFIKLLDNLQLYSTKSNIKDYMIIVFTANNRTAAENFMFRTRDLGYENANVGVFNCSKYYSVVADSFDSEEEAKKFLNQIKNRKPFSLYGPYLLKREPQISPCENSSLPVRP
mgnify:CR=1 FL=1